MADSSPWRLLCAPTRSRRWCSTSRASRSAGRSPRPGWPPYRALLEQGDTRGAFACFVQGFGAGPVAKLPRRYLRAVLRCVIRKRRWVERYEPLLQANLAEHEQVTACNDHIASYGAITARLLLLGGSRSPAIMTTLPLERLQQRVPDATVDIIEGLDHLAPDEKTPRSSPDGRSTSYSPPGSWGSRSSKRRPRRPSQLSIADRHISSVVIWRLRPGRAHQEHGRVGRRQAI